MKKLYRQAGWWLLIASISTLYFIHPVHSAPVKVPVYTFQDPIKDTTHVSCDSASIEFNTWINSTTLFLSLTAFPGAMIEVIPLPVTYSFPGTCSDTLSYTFKVTGTKDTSLVYTLIISDKTAPRIVSTIADSLHLGCKDPIPARTTVTVTDNCALDTVLFNEVIEGGGQCPYSYKIIRTWNARDDCGNASSYRQVIIVSDDLAPEFRNFPRDTVIDCTQAPIPQNTGRPTAVDSCDLNARVDYFDQLTPTRPGCSNDYSIRRTWSAKDTCGNVAFRTQIITVRDIRPPTFTAPRDTSVSCEVGDNPAVTGRPTNLRDNCDTLGPQNLRYKDVIISTSCTNTYIVRRTWYVFDNCGNTDSTLQEIRVSDNQAPVFSRQATDLVMQCTANLAVDSLFRAWINRNGDAVATDNCSSTIKWIARNSATQDTASLPDPVCNANGQIILSRSVDFIAEDACGQRTTSTAVFRIVDLQRPRISVCVRDTQVVTAPGTCSASFKLPAPQIQEECNIGAKAFPQLGGVRLSYRIGQGQVTAVGDIQQAMVQLPAGNSRITYYVTDCGGNIDSCAFNVFVKDMEAPQLSCPGDTLLVLSEGACSVTLPLRLPTGATDNCNELNFPAIRPNYYATGASPIPLTALSAPGVAPTHIFNRGTTNVFFILRDSSGNADTCNYRIVVEDREKPIARCQPSTLFVNPSGLQDPTVSATEIDAGSSDNCGIASRVLSPNTFNCLQAGFVQNVTLTVTDFSGNTAVCSTIVRIENLEPQPLASTGLCGSDTLFLRANPPAAQGGVIYTFAWTGPNGFSSTRENPIVPNVSSRNAGSYSVEITGITGCKARGVVEVSIEDLPLTPELLSPANYCEADDLVFNSSVAPSGASVLYRWYRGAPPTGTLVATTIVPSFTLTGPHTEGSYSYYLTVESNGCVSRPSAPKTIQINKKPVAIPRDNAVTVCESTPINLGTDVAGPGITYEWKGPGGFFSNSQYPIIAKAVLSNAGVYTLTIFRNGCPSAPAFVTVAILPKPETPQLSNTGPVCAGDQVTLRTNAPGSVYTWVSPDLQEFSTNVNFFQINAASAAVRGDWRVFVTAQGCKSELSLPNRIIINDQPRPAIAVSPGIVCENGRLQLNATPIIANANYRWTGPGSFLAVGTSASVENVQLQDSGRYIVTIITPEGCVGSAFTDVKVRRSLRIQAVTNDAPNCLSGPTDIRLTASLFPTDDGTYIYQWTGPNGFLSTSRIGLIPNATQANNGNYQLVVSTREGCSSQPSGTVVSVADPPSSPGLPQISGDLPVTLCTGQEFSICTNGYPGTDVTYHWSTPDGGLVVTNTPCLDIRNAKTENSGAYSVFVTVNGCRSRTSGSLSVKVNEKPVISASNNGPVCSGAPLELRSTFIPGAIYRWSGPNLNSSLPNPVIQQAQVNLHSGTYSVFAELNGCRSEIATTQASVLPLPVTPQIEPVAPLCISRTGAALTLRLRTSTVTPGAIYTWTGPNGTLGSSLSPEWTISNFSGYSNGIMPFSVQAILGKCASVDPQTLTVQLNTIPEDIAFAGADFAACDARPVMLQGQEPRLGSGRWSLVQGPNPNQVVFASPTRGNTNVTGLKGPALYTFRWTLSNGACTNYASDEVDITVSQQDTADAGKDTLVCLFPQISLAARPSINGTGTWSQSPVQGQLGIQILQPNDPRSPVTGMQPGNLYEFVWTIRDGCGTTNDVVLVLISDPDPYAGPDQSICNSTATAQLSANEPTSGSRGRWYGLNSSVDIATPSTRQTALSNLQPGPNSFVWEIDDGICGQDSRDTMVINYRTSPRANPDQLSVPFGQPSTLPLLLNDNFSDTVRISIVKNPARGTIQIQSDSVVVYKPNANFVGRDQMTYELCSRGCECSTAEVILEIGEDVGCAVPTVITPNNDGINDALVIPCLLQDNAFPNAQLLIFNRWGDEVFRSERPYLNNWSGTYNGEDLPVGTYFYVFDLGDGSAPVRGFIVVQR